MVINHVISYEEAVSTRGVKNHRKTVISSQAP